MKPQFPVKTHTTEVVFFNVNIIYVPLSILSATKIITKVVEPKIKVIEGSLQPIIKTEGKNQCRTWFLLLGKVPCRGLISTNVPTFFLTLTCSAFPYRWHACVVGECGMQSPGQSRWGPSNTFSTFACSVPRKPGGFPRTRLATAAAPGPAAQERGQSRALWLSQSLQGRHCFRSRTSRPTWVSCPVPRRSAEERRGCSPNDLTERRSCVLLTAFKAAAARDASCSQTSRNRGASP